MTIVLLLLASVAVFAAAARSCAAARPRASAPAPSPRSWTPPTPWRSRLRTARVEIEAIVGTDDNPVRDALQEMLRQRLWLQQHGDAATLEQLSQVRDSIHAGAERIDQQLVRIERARAPAVH